MRNVTHIDDVNCERKQNMTHEQKTERREKEKKIETKISSWTQNMCFCSVVRTRHFIFPIFFVFVWHFKIFQYDFMYPMNDE